MPHPAGTHMATAVPQRPGTPPPPQVAAPAQVPQLMVPVQPSLIVPQVMPAGQAVIGVHGSRVMMIPPVPGSYDARIEFIGVRSPAVGVVVVA